MRQCNTISYFTTFDDVFSNNLVKLNMKTVVCSTIDAMCCKSTCMYVDNKVCQVDYVHLEADLGYI